MTVGAKHSPVSGTSSNTSRSSEGGEIGRGKDRGTVSGGRSTSALTFHDVLEPYTHLQYVRTCNDHLLAMMVATNMPYKGWGSFLLVHIIIFLLVLSLPS